MALTAAVYRMVGGLEPNDVLEDERLERSLRKHGVPIERLLSVRVATSARLVGRANRGLDATCPQQQGTLKWLSDGARRPLRPPSNHPDTFVDRVTHRSQIALSRTVKRDKGLRAHSPDDGYGGLVVHRSSK